MVGISATIIFRHRRKMYYEFILSKSNIVSIDVLNKQCNKTNI